MRARSSTGRAPPLQGGCCRFESCRVHLCSTVAQWQSNRLLTGRLLVRVQPVEPVGDWLSWLERLVYTEEVVGSSPTSPIRFGLLAQWLEQRTHNPLVAGSSPAGPMGLDFRGGYSSVVERLVVAQEAVGSRPTTRPRRGVAQFGSALAWGARGRWFESSRPDCS